MSRGLSKQQNAVLGYLRAVPLSTTQEIAEAVLAEKVRRRRGSYDYGLDARQTLLRSLHSLEKRGLVIGSLLRGDDIKWTGTSGKKYSVPVRERVWELAPPDFTAEAAAQKIKDDIETMWLNKIRRRMLAYAKESEVQPGGYVTVLEDDDISIELNNYSNHEEWLEAEERSQGHIYVVGVNCGPHDIGSFRASGPTATEAMHAALQELESRLQLHS